MRIGIAIGLHGPPAGGAGAAVTWPTIEAEVRAAEEAGFDVVTVEDVFLEATSGAGVGYWESVAIAGAIAQATTRIQIAHSVFNAP